MRIYTVRDSTVGAYLPPYYARNDAEAIRMIVDTANEPKTVFHNHPMDFDLFYIGEFMETTGEIFPADHKHIGLIADLMGPFNEK